MPAHSLHELMLHEMRDMYDAEQQLCKALPKMIEAAHHPELKKALKDHLAQTENQVSRLEEAFALLGEEPKTEACAGMEGIVKEGNKALSMRGNVNASVQDAAIIASGQRVEHYEMAAYGAICSFAKEMGHERVAALMHETLEEEKAADKLLSSIAQDEVNRKANVDGMKQRHHEKGMMQKMKEMVGAA